MSYEYESRDYLYPDHRQFPSWVGGLTLAIAAPSDADVEKIEALIDHGSRRDWTRKVSHYVPVFGLMTYAEARQLPPSNVYRMASRQILRRAKGVQPRRLSRAWQDYESWVLDRLRVMPGFTEMSGVAQQIVYAWAMGAVVNIGHCTKEQYEEAEVWLLTSDMYQALSYKYGKLGWIKSKLINPDMFVSEDEL